MAVKGKINVEKKGEVLVDFKDGKFIYEERGLANAKYEIYGILLNKVLIYRV